MLPRHDGTNLANAGYRVQREQHDGSSGILAQAELAAEPSDSELIFAAGGGDLDAYEELVRRYQDLAFRSAFLITREATSAEDATQEAFIRAYRNLSRFRQDHPFRPWLLHIVSNEAKRRLTNRDRHARLELHLLRTQPPCDSPVERQILTQEVRSSLAGAVARLPENDRIVIAYRYALDLSEAEMAVALGCPRGTVKSRLSRAMEKLRTALTPPEMELLRVGLMEMS